METPYDWITVAIFAGLIVLFLQRSSEEGEPRDHIWQYLLAAVGCGTANYIGNHDDVPYHHVLAIVTILGTCAFVWFVLKPFEKAK